MFSTIYYAICWYARRIPNPIRIVIGNVKWAAKMEQQTRRLA
jgi:hypothetical protein